MIMTCRPKSKSPLFRARRRLLDDLDLFLGQPVQLVDQPVDLPVRRRDLPLQGGLGVGGSPILIRAKTVLIRTPAFAASSPFRVPFASLQFAQVSK
jgi:hypothetical protein